MKCKSCGKYIKYVNCHHFAYECAIKGIDIEETLRALINTYKGVFDIVIKQTNKNYDYLLKCRETKEVEE